MKIKEIRSKYKNYLENVSVTQNILNDLILSLREFLTNYRKSKIYDKEIAHELDVNLHILERLHSTSDSVFDKIECLTLNKIKIVYKKNEILYSSSDDDIYVNKNKTIKW